MKLGLKCEGIYFYHYHPLPPVFENFDQLYFRKLSWKMEDQMTGEGFYWHRICVDCKRYNNDVIF